MYAKCIWWIINVILTRSHLSDLLSTFIPPPPPATKRFFCTLAFTSITFCFIFLLDLFFFYFLSCFSVLRYIKSRNDKSKSTINSVNETIANILYLGFYFTLQLNYLNSNVKVGGIVYNVKWVQQMLITIYNLLSVNEAHLLLNKKKCKRIKKQIKYRLTSEYRENGKNWIRCQLYWYSVQTICLKSIAMIRLRYDESLRKSWYLLNIWA